MSIDHNFYLQNIFCCCSL